MSIRLTSELKKKILITIGILTVIRLGCQIPTYGVNTDFFNALLMNNSSLAFFNTMTGNSLKQLSIFSLSITPYITASIIMQLLTIAFPALAEIAKDGAEGHKKMERITYIFAGAFGYVQALAMAIGFGRQGLLLSYKWYNCLIVALIWGTFALISIYLGKLIDKKGIGNGISLILLANILSSLPSDLYSIFTRFISNRPTHQIIINSIIVLIVILLFFGFALILNNAEKRISIQYSGKVVGRRSSSGGATTMPIKVLIMGVMPIIFASSVISVPGIICSFIKYEQNSLISKCLNVLNVSNWFDPSNMKYTIGYILYVVLVVFFGYFYTAISFNTYEIAENLKKSGGTILGIRPGKPTVDYLDKQVKYLIVIGTVGLLILATLPMVISGVFNMNNLSFGGTTIIIAVSVIFDTKKKFELETMPASVGKKLSNFHYGK